MNYLKFNGSGECAEDHEKIYPSQFLNFPAIFSKRTGRKFLFNWTLGVRDRQTKIKLGTPNFMVTYYKDRKTPSLDASMPLIRKEFKTNILIYPTNPKGKNKEEDKGDFLLDETRYLIGVDRGENKLFSYTIWDNQESKIVDQGEIGGEFKNKIDNLKKDQAKALSGFKVNEYKKKTKKISNALIDSVNDAINQLLLLAFKYRDSEKATGFVFEFLGPSFSRVGSKAYVELRQMNKLIVKIKEARNFYNMPFQIYETGAYYTSQICSKCGNIDKESRHGEYYQCVKCNHAIDADIQASFSIIHKWIGMKKPHKDTATKEIMSNHLKNLNFECFKNSDCSCYQRQNNITA